MSRPVIIHNWSVREDGQSPYRAPELSRKYIAGQSGMGPDGSPRYITTSHIADVNGRLVTTRSGSVYRLGSIDPEYREWLRDNDISFDPRNPICIKGRA